MTNHHIDDAFSLIKTCRPPSDLQQRILSRVRQKSAPMAFPQLKMATVLAMVLFGISVTGVLNLESQDEALIAYIAPEYTFDLADTISRQDMLNMLLNKDTKIKGGT